MTDKTGDKPSLGEYLRLRRASISLTLRDIGSQHGLKSGYLSQLETGMIKDITVTRLIAVTTAYGLPMGDVLFDVYGVQSDAVGAEEISRATSIGRQVLSLPESQRDLIIDLIDYKAQKPRT